MPAPTTATVIDIVLNPAGEFVAGTTVTLRGVGSLTAEAALLDPTMLQSLQGPVEERLTSAVWQRDLRPNAPNSPANNYYLLTKQVPGRPAVPAPFTVPVPTSTTTTGIVDLAALTTIPAATAGFDAATPSAPRLLSLGGRVFVYTGVNGPGTAFTGVTLISGTATGTIASGQTVKQAYWVGSILNDPPASLPTLLSVLLMSAAGAAFVGFTPTGSVAAGNVQAAIAEVANEAISADVALANALAGEVTRATAQENLKLAKASNLSDVANPATALANLGGIGPIPSGTFADYAEGLIGARPAANAVPNKSLYLATDESGGTLYRSNGSTWVQVAPAVSAGLNAEGVQDIVGAMVASNTETGITVTYDDAAGKLDFVVPAVTAGDPGTVYVEGYPGITLGAGQSTPTRQANRTALAAAVAEAVAAKKKLMLPSDTLEVHYTEGAVGMPIGGNLWVDGYGEGTSVIDMYPKGPLSGAIVGLAVTGGLGTRRVKLSNFTAHGPTVVDTVPVPYDVPLHSSYFFQWFETSFDSVFITQNVEITGLLGTGISRSGGGLWIDDGCQVNAYAVPYSFFESTNTANEAREAMFLSSKTKLSAYDSQSTSVGLYIHPHMSYIITGGFFDNFGRFGIYQNGSPTNVPHINLCTNSGFEHCAVQTKGGRSQYTSCKFWGHTPIPGSNGPGGDGLANQGFAFFDDVHFGDCDFYNANDFGWVGDESHEATFDACRLHMGAGTVNSLGASTAGDDTYRFRNCEWYIDGGAALNAPSSFNGRVYMENCSAESTATAVAAGYFIQANGGEWWVDVKGRNMRTAALFTDGSSVANIHVDELDWHTAVDVAAIFATAAGSPSIDGRDIKVSGAGTLAAQSDGTDQLRLIRGVGQNPATVASAATIDTNVPAWGRYDTHVLTGATQINTLANPWPFVGRVTLIAATSATWSLGTAGNILPRSIRPMVAGDVRVLEWVPSISKWCEVTNWSPVRLPVLAGDVSGTTTLDISGGREFFDHRLVGDTTFQFGTPPDALPFQFRMLTEQDGTGGRVITWPNSIDWEAGAAPTPATTAGLKHLWHFLKRDGNGDGPWLGMVFEDMDGAVEPFDPDSLSGMIGRYKANSLSLNDGDPVESWTDISGNGNHLASSGSRRPTFKTNQVGAKAVVRFVTDDWMDAAIADQTQPFTIVLVYKSVDGCLFSDFTGHYCGYRIGGNLYMNFGSGLNGGAVDTSGYHLSMWVGDGASSEHYLDNAAAVTGGVNTGSLTELVVGSASGGSAFLDGDIAELIVYAGDHAASIADFRSYSAGEYGIP